MNTYRHGDLSFHSIKEMPNDIKETKNNVLALGETTGHKHVVTGDVQIFQDTLGNTYIKVNGKASVTHEEHRKVELKKGLYKMFNEREFDWFQKATVKVLD